MCFSPQRRAIFQHLKCFSPQRRAIFPTSQRQKVLRTPQFFSIFTSKCASRYSGVQFLISPLTTWLRTRRFNEPTFRLTRHTNHLKNTAFRDFSNIWRGCIFFLLTFALLHRLSSDFISSHLLFICFSTLHIVGSLLFKLPSTTQVSNTKSHHLSSSFGSKCPCQTVHVHHRFLQDDRCTFATQVLMVWRRVLLPSSTSISWAVPDVFGEKIQEVTTTWCLSFDGIFPKQNLYWNEVKWKLS